MSGSPALRVTDLSVTYGAVKALTDVDLDVNSGELVGLIGPNGAGKTTLIDAVTGFLRCAGAVTISGQDVTRWQPDRRARLGLARTWQSGDLFEDLTVRENLAVASPHPGIRRAIADAVAGRLRQSDLVQDALQAMDLLSIAERPADELTEGQRKLVGVARALASHPSVICLDEPAAGLDRDESREMATRLRKLADQGLAVLLIDHDMDLVFSTCDRVVVLDFGRVIVRGAPEAVRTDPAVISAYIGGPPVIEGGTASQTVEETL